MHLESAVLTLCVLAFGTSETCEVPIIPHASSILLDPNLTTVALTCSEGFAINGTASQTGSASCLANGSWSFSLQCEPTRIVNLEALRKLSKEADKTQKWWVKSGSLTIWMIFVIGIFTVCAVLSAMALGKALVNSRQKAEEKARQKADKTDGDETEDSDPDEGAANEGINDEDMDTVPISFQNKGEGAWKMHLN